MIEVTASPVGVASVLVGQRRASVMPLIGDSESVAALTELMRTRAGISMNEVARRLGLKPSTVAQYKHQRRGRGMTVASLVRWASACGCQIVVELPR